MDLSSKKTLEKCRNLWLVQRNLRELLSKYGNCLETVRINPYNSEARLTLLSLVKDISRVGREQNELMEEYDKAAAQIPEMHFSSRSVLLENFRDALIRQLWSNGIEQCSEEIEDDIVKILFLNQMNLIPGNLSEYLSVAEHPLTKSIDVGNLQVNSGGTIQCPGSSFNGLENCQDYKIKVPEERPIEHSVEAEPRCTRSSKPLLKRGLQEEDGPTKLKSRRKGPSLIEKPNACCYICEKLFHSKDVDIEDTSKLICCNICNDRFCTSVIVTSHSSSNIEDPISPSDLSSQNDTP